MREFGTVISGNARSIGRNSRELTAIKRAAMVRARMAGVLNATIAREFGYHIRTVKRTFKRF